MKEPHYVSPIFASGDPIENCTINVYKSLSTSGQNNYAKSRYADDALARLEPKQSWGKLLYRIRVIVHEQG